HLALLFVAQHLIGFVDLFKSSLGIRIVGIRIRVIFLRQLTEGALDLFFGGVALDAKYLIVVSSHMITLPISTGKLPSLDRMTSGLTSQLGKGISYGEFICGSQL